jgi:hypothetical protein
VLVAAEIIVKDDEKEVLWVVAIITEPRLMAAAALVTSTRPVRDMMMTLDMIL